MPAWWLTTYTFGEGADELKEGFDRDCHMMSTFRSIIENPNVHPEDITNNYELILEQIDQFIAFVYQQIGRLQQKIDDSKNLLQKVMLRFAKADLEKMVAQLKAARDRVQELSNHFDPSQISSEELNKLWQDLFAIQKALGCDLTREISPARRFALPAAIVIGLGLLLIVGIIGGGGMLLRGLCNNPATIHCVA